MKLHKQNLCLAMATLFVATAIAEEATAKLEAAGIVEPFRRVKIGARVTGILETVVVEEGAVVKEGDVLAKMDDKAELYVVEYYDAQARLWEAKKKMTEALKGIETEDRIKEVIAQGEMADARLKQSQKAFEDKTIRAPVPGGIVTRRFKHPGEAVEEREDVFEIINVDRVYFLAYFDSKDYRRMKVGQTATVTLELDSQQKFEGKVYFVDPAVDAGSGQFRVKVVLENLEHRITAGVKGKVQIVEGAERAAAR